MINKIKIIIILLLILINILLYFKQKNSNSNNIEYFLPINCESIDSEYINGEYIGSEFIPTKEEDIILPENFVFDTNAKVSAHIEQFFKLYIKLINVDFINKKIAQYAGPTTSMQKIFSRNNLTLFSLNDELKKIDLIYIAKNRKISNRVIYYYGIYKLIKIKLRNELDKTENFIYKYETIIDSECPNKIIGYDIYLFPKKWEESKIKQEGILISSEHREDKKKGNIENKGEKEEKYERKHTKYCTENEICKIKHKDLFNEDLLDQFKDYKDFENYRKNMASSLNTLIKITELEIVKKLLIENNKKDHLSTFQAKVIVPLNKEIADYIKG